MKWLKWLFTEHPAEAGETYLEHMKYAANVSLRLALYSFYLTICCFSFIIHAIVPAIPVHKKFNLENIGKKGFRFLKEGVQRDRQREDFQQRR